MSVQIVKKEFNHFKKYIFYIKKDNYVVRNIHS